MRNLGQFRDGTSRNAEGCGIRIGRRRLIGLHPPRAIYQHHPIVRNLNGGESDRSRVGATHRQQLQGRADLHPRRGWARMARGKEGADESVAIGVRPLRHDHDDIRDIPRGHPVETSLESPATRHASSRRIRRSRAPYVGEGDSAEEPAGLHALQVVLHQQGTSRLSDTCGFSAENAHRSLMLRPAEPGGGIGHRQALRQLSLSGGRCQRDSQQTRAGQRVDRASAHSRAIDLGGLVRDRAKERLDVRRQRVRSRSDKIHAANIAAAAQ